MIFCLIVSSVTHSPNASTKSPSLGLTSYLFGCGQSVPHIILSGLASIKALAIGITSSYGGRSVALTLLAPEIFIHVFPSLTKSKRVLKPSDSMPLVAG